MLVKEYSKYIMVIIFLIILYFTFLLVRPFIASLLTSLVIAYVFYPLYTKVNKYIKKNNLCALVVSVFLIILITVPLFFIVNSVIKEVFVIYTIGEQRIVSGNILGVDCVKNPKICKRFDFLTSNLKFRYYIEEHLGQFRDFFTNYLTEVIFSIPRRVLDIALTMFIVFYLFRDGKVIRDRLKSLFSLKEHHQKPLIKQLNDITYAVIYGNILIAIIEGIIGGIAFWIVGIPSPIFWGLVMTILAFLPIIGAGVVWSIAALTLLLNGNIWPGITLVFFGMIITSIDIFIKPNVIGDRAKVHPVWVILGVLGGIPLFGPTGFIIGPLILALLLTFIEIYEKENILDFGS